LGGLCGPASPAGSSYSFLAPEVSVHHFSSDYLFQTPPFPGPFFTALTACLGLLFVASALVYWRRGKLAPDNPVRRRFIRRASKAGMWTSATALFLCLMRYLQIDYLAMPIWLYLWLLAMITVVAYFVYDLSEHYPVAVWQLQQSHVERRYRPAAKPRRDEPQRPRPKVRGKRRR
jgi:hypothetical protein